MQKLLARDKLQAEAEDLCLLIFCGCIRVELLFYEEDGEVNLSVRLMLRFAVELMFCMFNLCCQILSTCLSTNTISRFHDCSFTYKSYFIFFPFILPKKLGFA